ncbi:MAG: response regulator, partial [Candidatus Hodarchaeales archaeon]
MTYFNNDFRNIKVLHVDDDTGFLELSKEYLEFSNNYTRIEIDGMEDPEKVISLIQEKNYDAVVSDYMMPEMNGLQLLEQIRAFSDIPFIILTGQGREEVAI